MYFGYLQSQSTLAPVYVVNDLYVGYKNDTEIVSSYDVNYIVINSAPIAKSFYHPIDHLYPYNVSQNRS